VSSRCGQALLHILLVAAVPLCGHAQSGPDVPQQYKRLFFQYADRRPLYEKALNLAGQSSLPVGRSYALIIGVTQFPNFAEAERSLRPAAVDIEKLERYLKEQEHFDEIVVLKDGDFNFENLNYFLQTYFPAHLKNSPHARFLLAFSGHGYADVSANDARGFLLTSSATTVKDEVNRIGLDILRTLILPDIAQAEKTLVLINSCQSGAFLGRKTFGVNPLGPGERGAHAIMASRTNQQSFQLDAVGPGSVFFEKIFAGLEGAADTSPRDGIVTYHELDSYLHQEIPYATHGAQNPMEGDISLNGSVGEFFFLNRSQQAKLGNSKPWNPGSAQTFGIAENDLYEKGLSALREGHNEEAFRAFSESAEAGNLSAMNNLGALYAAGQGVVRDFKQARFWWDKSASSGDSHAMFNIGFSYERGLGVVKDYQQARKWYDKAADAGHAGAMNNLGLLYTRGQGVGRDYQWARTWFERAAIAGSAEGMGNLGSLYESGNGVEKDYQQAAKWYEKAATAGSAVGMSNLGYMYSEGRGLPQDYKQARQWFEKAANAGDAEGMNNLGSIFGQGLGVTQDYQQAHQWYEKAAAAGSANGMFNLGYLYAQGYGVAQDKAQARRLYEKAAIGGNVEAMINLGAIYSSGDGVAIDYKQARMWFEKAAAAGNGVAMLNLGLLYEQGQGVPQDYQWARLWYQRAAAKGEEHAIERLKEMKQ